MVKTNFHYFSNVMLPEKTLEIKNNRRLLSEKEDATQLYRDGAILRRVSSLYIYIYIYIRLKIKPNSVRIRF